METISLHNEEKIPRVMLGSFQMKDPSALDAVVRAAAKNGVYGFDSAPSYQTEEMLVQSIRQLISEDHTLKREQFFLQTKIDSWQMINRKGRIRPFVEKSLETCHLDYWDLLLIHWPQPEYYVKTWLEMEKLYDEGLVKNIGVCNFSVRHFKTLQRSGTHIMPMVAQNEIYPLNTENEIVRYCQQHQIALQAYSPLGRMIPEVKYNALLNILAERHHVSVAQIILRWHIQRGLIPVVKTKNPARIEENTNLFFFSLTDEEMDAITGLDQHLKIFLESRCCPGY